MKHAIVLSTMLAMAALGASSNASADGAASFKGGVLVDSRGMTLYTFDKDPAGAGKSACNGACAGVWPPLSATGGDAAGGDFSVITRDDGSKQIAHKGRPLYFYAPDQKPGDMTGDNSGGVWHVVRAVAATPGQKPASGSPFNYGY
jgi:predicted lipoprotein with Yx(FWY)xxD motif